MRQEGATEGFQQAKMQNNEGGKGKQRKGKKNEDDHTMGSSSNFNKNNGGNTKQSYPPCQHCQRRNHPHFTRWRRPDVRYNNCKQLGHIAKIRRTIISNNKLRHKLLIRRKRINYLW